MKVQDITSVQAFDQALKTTDEVAVHFWAPWSAPCKQMDLVFAELAAQCSAAAFLRVEAEEVPDVTERYSVSMVPHFLLIKKQKLEAEIEGADAPLLNSKVSALFAVGPANTQSSAAGPKKAPAAEPQQSAETTARIRSLLASAPVLLFMKGTPEAPRCGFSAKTVAALRNAGCEFSTFDILSDDSIRQGLKAYSQWPTYPQLYAGGDLIGGCDLVLELQSTGDLKSTIDEAIAGPPDHSNRHLSLKDRLKQLTTAAQIVLFMKGTPSEPRCGFSRQVVGALQDLQLPFNSFDILQDEEVRQGLKEYSRWPTYPQLYVKGELMGGCDLILELHKNGELKEAIQEAGE